MSRTAATTGLTMVRGSTWEDYLDYYEDDGITPIDLTGFEARMQVWPLEEQYGTTGTPLLTLASTGGTPQLFIEAIAGSGSSAKNRVRIAVDVADHAMLNPDNEKQVKYAFGAQVYQPGTPEYVLPYAKGKLTCQGETVR